MALPDWVVIGGIASGIIAAVVNGFRVRPEARKMHADGSAAITNSGAAILAAVQEEMTSLRAEVADLKRWRHRKERLDRVHLRWDDEMVKGMRALGQNVDDPPPLYVDD